MAGRRFVVAALAAGAAWSAAAVSSAPAASGARPAGRHAGAARHAGASRHAGAGGHSGSSSCGRSAGATAKPPVVAVDVVDRGKGVLAVAKVCVEGHGPYGFVVDTGSSETVIRSSLARRLGIRPTGPREEASGIGCTLEVTPEKVTRWSIDGMALRPQAVVAAAIPSLGPGVHVDGVLGSDVLSRFGSVRIDYRQATVSFGGPERSSPTPKGVVEGSPDRPAHLPSGVKAWSPLEVTSQSGAVAAYAPVRLHGSAPQPFLVDTGARISSVSAPVARSFHLRRTHGHVHLSGFGCPVDLPEVSSGSWSLGTVSLSRQRLARLPSSGLKEPGLLGSDVLSRDGAVVVDYRHGRLLLEEG